jgi:polyphenol oxidase
VIIQSSLLSEIDSVTHGFGTLDESIPKLFQNDWAMNKPEWTQVHGCSVGEVNHPRQECGKVDALFTSRSRIPVAVQTADCVPILMARLDGTKVAAVHAGWRGIRAFIILKLWNELKAQGEQASNWVAAIGPAIGPCCYQVSKELAKEFLETFDWMDPFIAEPKDCYLDLAAIQKAELERLGLYKVELISICTFCNTSPLFASYRRAKGNLGGTRQFSIIMIKND